MTDTTTQDPATQDPEQIERDIRRTQQDMSRTVDRIGDQLTMRNIFNALLDKADENDVDARMIVDGARRNPIALGLIAAGAIWLVSDKDSKFPTLKKPGSSGGSDESDFGSQDIHHRDYVSHMSSLEMRQGEDPMDYQRRRDMHRATFMMCERRPDEDEHSFRQRLDEMTEKFREKRRAWSDSASHAGAATSQAARRAAGRAEDLYSSNPLVGGILAVAVGAAFGSAFPITRQEQEKLGSVGEKAREVASEKKDQVQSKLREKKDEFVDKADEKLHQSSAGSGSSESQPTGSGSQRSQPDAPFIIGEPTR